jgi:hypothetical protein
MSKREAVLLTKDQVKDLRTKIALCISKLPEDTHSKRLEIDQREDGGTDVTSVIIKDWGKLGGLYFRLSDHASKRSGMYDGVTVEKMQKAPKGGPNQRPTLKVSYGVVTSFEQLQRAWREHQFDEDEQDKDEQD